MNIFTDMSNVEMRIIKKSSLQNSIIYDKIYFIKVETQ